MYSSTSQGRFARVAAWAMAALASAGCASIAPTVDHHQHVFSPSIVALLATAERPFHELTARDIVAELDKAGIRRAVLLSVAYLYGAPGRAGADALAKVQAENDWTAAQATLYPERLVAFCGFNPLADYALAELERCAADPALRRGIKLHLANSDVQLDDPCISPGCSACSRRPTRAGWRSSSTSAPASRASARMARARCASFSTRSCRSLPMCRSRSRTSPAAGRVSTTPRAAGDG